MFILCVLCCIIAVIATPVFMLTGNPIAAVVLGISALCAVKIARADTDKGGE